MDGDEKTTYTTGAFASMLTSALHIGFACSQERHVKFNRCAGSSHTNPIYSNKIVGQRLTLENVIFDSIQEILGKGPIHDVG